LEALEEDFVTNLVGCYEASNTVFIVFLIEPEIRQRLSLAEVTCVPQHSHETFIKRLSNVYKTFAQKRIERARCCLEQIPPAALRRRRFSVVVREAWCSNEVHRGSVQEVEDRHTAERVRGYLGRHYRAQQV